MPQVIFVNPKARRGKGGRFVSNPANPKRRRRKMRRNPVQTFQGNRARRGRRRFRSNPAGVNVQALLRDTVTPTLIGAGGALAADVAIGFLPLPAALQGPAMRPLVKGSIAVLLGMLAGMASTRATGAKVMAGALTVVAYDTLRGLVQRMAPQIPLGGLAENEFPLLSYAGDNGEMGEVLDVPASDAGVGELIDPLGELLNLGQSDSEGELLGQYELT